MSAELAVKTYNQSFYQTTDSAVVSFLGTRGLTEKDGTVEITKDTLHVVLRPENYMPFEKTILLFDEVDPELSTFKFTPSKLEITLHKAHPCTWNSIDRNDALGHHIVTSTMNCPTTSNQSSAPSRPVNPYSSKKDWTKIEIENDEEENDPKKMSGDESLQAFFQSIYKNADDDTRKAMMKSFQMSGGKCLSTNWSDVKNKDYTKEEN